MCWTCYRNPKVRSRYARDPRGPTDPDHEPTAEEVEATIREQMERLPDWWGAECYEKTVYVVVRCD